MRTRIARIFRDGSIRVKVSLLVVFNGSFALALVGVFLLSYQKFELHEAAARELSIQAGIVADSCTAALSFADERAAAQTLAALRRDPNLVEAAIYDRENQLFAWYERDLERGAKPPPVELEQGSMPTGPYIKNGNLYVRGAVAIRGQPLGTVWLKASMQESDARLHRYIGLLCVVLLVSLGLALLLSGRMQKAIAGPLAELSGVARVVSMAKDYSLRATRKGGGEVGFLIDSFNEMLAQIESQEQARKMAEESLRESEERFALAARGANDGLWDWKRSTGQMYLSPRGNQMLGYPELERFWSIEEWVMQIHHCDRARVLAEWIEGIRKGKDEFISEYRIRQPNNTSIWVLSRGKSVKDAGGEVERVAGSLTDITEGKVADALTGLRSRFYFLDRLDSLLEEGCPCNQPFAVLFLDLDRFKLVNDSLGHAAGDEFLVEIASRLRTSVLGAGSLVDEPCALPVVARLGGDEFAILFYGASQEQAKTLAQRILQSLSAAISIGNQQMFPGVSIGISIGPSGETAEDLLRNADTAMYQAKKAGRGRIEVFDEGMRNRAQARLEIEAQLRRAIDEGQLVVFYQPQISFHLDRMTGFEALVRWQHPERGLVEPAEFISIAEETDLIIPLGRWVLREAARQMLEWQQRFPFEPPLTVSVNVSYKQLKDASFVQDVKRILTETGLPPETLRLEMTESMVMSDAEETAETLRRLKEIKVGLEIDDFGTGYSSLSCLSRLPFDTVKIDRTFVRDLGSSEEATEIVKAILELARSMNMTVVAEGVETSDQLRELNALGCSHAQGYYFSKPVGSAAIEFLLESQHLRGQLQALEQGLRTEEYAVF